MVAALASAGAALGRPEWASHASSAYRFLTETMMVNDRLTHSAKDGGVLGIGFAGDYAAMMKAAIALHQAVQNETYLDDAGRYAEALDRHYWDEAASAYRMTADDAEALIMRPLPLHDDSVPSANATVAAALARLANLTGSTAYGERADRILAAYCGDARSVLGKAGLFNALDQRLNGTDIVIIGAPTEAADSDLARAVRREWRDSFALLLRENAGDLPASHPAHGKTAIDGRPTAFVCRGQTCSAPVTEPQALIELLRRRR